MYTLVGNTLFGIFLLNEEILSPLLMARKCFKQLAERRFLAFQEMLAFVYYVNSNNNNKQRHRVKTIRLTFVFLFSFFSILFFSLYLDNQYSNPKLKRTETKYNNTK
jgi:hypothetical protein